MLIDGDKLLTLLDIMIDRAKLNIKDYTDFHGEESLADLKNMDNLDSYLYGLASGKLEMLEYFKLMLQSRKEELESTGD